VDPVAVDETVHPVAEHFTEVSARPPWPAAARAYAISLTSGATINNKPTAASVSVNTNSVELF
jgi:hypothetical protein